MLTSVFLGGFQRECLQVDYLAVAFPVGGVQADVETQSRLQTTHSEVGVLRRDITDQLTTLGVEHFHNELLLKATVETLDAFHVEGFGRLVLDGAVGKGVRFALKEKTFSLLYEMSQKI